MIYMIIFMCLCSSPAMLFGFNIGGGNFQTNKHMDSNVIITKDKIGPKMCIKDCMLYIGCNGVNYIRDELTCELLSIFYPDDKLIFGNGTYFTNINKWTQEVNSCYPNPCQENTYCVEALYNQYVCVTFDVPCDSNPCLNSGTCRNGVNRYTCNCPSGYYGTICQYTPCTDKHCNNGGYCVISGSGWYCFCPSGYYGTYCQYTPCTPYRECVNGGYCIISGSGWKCSCPSGYYGTHCQYTPCTVDRECVNGGYCIISGSSWECSCPYGYYGTHCQYDPCTLGCKNGGWCTVDGLRGKCCTKDMWNQVKCEYQ